MCTCVCVCVGVSRGEVPGQSEDPGPAHGWIVHARSAIKASIVYVCVWRVGAEPGRIREWVRTSLIAADVKLQLLGLICPDGNNWRDWDPGAAGGCIECLSPASGGIHTVHIYMSHWQTFLLISHRNKIGVVCIDVSADCACLCWSVWPAACIYTCCICVFMYGRTDNTCSASPLFVPGAHSCGSLSSIGLQIQSPLN